MELYVLASTAVFLGFFHTLIGPDHYIPFIAIGKAGNWKSSKVLFFTAICGLGHVLASVVLSFIGILISWDLQRLDVINGIRGDIASYLLIAFGLLYMIWGIWRGISGKAHRHVLPDGEEAVHSHEKKSAAAPWALFLVFILGPCEVLIPLLIFAAVKYNMLIAAGVAVVYGISTILVMAGITLLSLKGLSFIKFDRFEKYSHAIAGGAVLMSALAVALLGL